MNIVDSSGWFEYFSGGPKAEHFSTPFNDFSSLIVPRKRGVPADNPAWKILNETKKIHKRISVSGLISTDRIFGVAKGNFLGRDIEDAVDRAFQPTEPVDLSALLTETSTNK